MDRTRAEKRFIDYKKAKRKEYISKHIYGFDCYNNLNQYSKNKVCYSRPMCTQIAKNNHKKFKSRSKKMGFDRWSRSQYRYSNNLSRSDNIKIIRLEEQLYG